MIKPLRHQQLQQILQILSSVWQHRPVKQPRQPHRVTNPLRSRLDPVRIPMTGISKGLMLRKAVMMSLPPPGDEPSIWHLCYSVECLHRCEP